MKRYIVFFENNGREEHETVDADSKRQAQEIFQARYNGRFEITGVYHEDELA